QWIVEGGRSSGTHGFSGGRCVQWLREGFSSNELSQRAPLGWSSPIGHRGHRPALESSQHALRLHQAQGIARRRTIRTCVVTARATLLIEGGCILSGSEGYECEEQHSNEVSHLSSFASSNCVVQC